MMTSSLEKQGYGDEVLYDFSEYYGDDFNFCEEETDKIIISDDFSYEEEVLDENHNYFEKIKSGNQEARDEFILKNEGLVYKMANKIASKYNINDKDDLVQAGFIGLINSLKRYDYKQRKFSTYANMYIYKEMIIHLKNTNHFKIPNYIYSNIKLVNKLIDKYIGITNNYRKAIELVLEDKEIISKKIDINELSFLVSLDKKRYNIVSFDFDFSNGDEGIDTQLYDIIPDENIKIEEEFLLKTERNEIFNKIGLILDNRDLLIIKKLYFNGYNMEQLATELGISGERIRVLRNKALEKLKSNFLKEKYGIK